ncbi:MAG TPA: hypothetical protein VEF76_01895 [Patescibacteria group bacterium]|nr:hypothetical protein [Patescibacteria group bacterium]
MFEPKKAGGLSKIFKSAMMSAGLLISAQPVLAQEAGPTPLPEPTPKGSTGWDDLGARGVSNSGGLNDRIDDYFAHKPTISITRESVWISPAARYDVKLLPLDNTPLTVTREYIEMKPMRKEWYGRAQGIEYGVQFNIGNSSSTAATGDWTYRGGFNLGYYDSPIERHGNRYTRESGGNSRVGVFAEGVKNVHVGSLPAALILGTSFNREAGNDVVNRNDARVYSEVNFPNLFDSKDGNEYGLGKFSGVVRSYAGTETYGAEAGLYYNNLKDDGKGINLSVGPEIRYDKERGTSFRVRFKFSPQKFW